MIFCLSRYVLLCVYSGDTIIEVVKGYYDEQQKIRRFCDLYNIGAVKE